MQGGLRFGRRSGNIPERLVAQLRESQVVTRPGSLLSQPEWLGASKGHRQQNQRPKWRIERVRLQTRIRSVVVWQTVQTSGRETRVSVRPLQPLELRHESLRVLSVLAEINSPFTVLAAFRSGQSCFQTRSSGESSLLAANCLRSVDEIGPCFSSSFE
jgi:hypothetical protein